MQLARLNFDQLIVRGISETVARFLTAQSHPIADVDILMRPIDPSVNYAIPADAVEIVGLWEDNADAYVRWQLRGSEQFVCLHHDDPDYCLIAWTEQGLLAELLRQFSEMVSDLSEAEWLCEVRAFAAYIGFRHTERLLDYRATESQAPDFFVEFLTLFGSLT